MNRYAKLLKSINPKPSETTLPEAIRLIRQSMDRIGHTPAWQSRPDRDDIEAEVNAAALSGDRKRLNQALQQWEEHYQQEVITP